MTEQKIKFSTIEQKIMDLLGDGKPHHRNQLWKLLDDPLAPMGNMQAHVSNVRKKLEKTGWTILHDTCTSTYALVHIIRRGYDPRL